VIEDPVPIGLHEAVVTNELDNSLARLSSDVQSDLAQIDKADLPRVLARHVFESAVRAFESADGTEARLELANRVIASLNEHRQKVLSPPKELLRVVPLAGPGVVTYDDVRPSTPLSEAALLTNAKSEPNLGPEIKTEIATADHVDLLCAFVRWAGLRLLDPELRRLKERGGRLRVITTTYTGSTERKALDKLVRDYGAEVRVQYDAVRTRLHAKAWMFRRNTGFDTAYVGSSNLTQTAMLDGVEWNVRLSRIATASLLDKFDATFDTYWNDSAFQLYDPDADGDRLDLALAEAGGRLERDHVTISLAGLDVRPYPYQQEMLDEIAAERIVHDRHRNLVVAATGTGKTVVAALDYRRLCEQEGGRRPRLLFVAHRKEILRQSLRTYREALADANFGELYVDSMSPRDWTHVFASVQSLSSYGIKQIPADAFDVVVIDEFHHAAARTYRAILDHLEPGELLGLTATPERADGTNVAQDFFEGRVASELRLWEAVDADLLCPFHYFAIADGTDLTRLKWRAGRYDETELSNLLTGNDVRARIVLRELRDKVLDPLAMRGLGFCASIDHAVYMTQVFNQAGIPATVVTGETPAQARAEAITALGEGRINVIFTVDVFNEGLDIPAVDTVLFLRPTESATIFLQQLGRGLRRTATKAVLTALDFVGHQHSRFRWDLKLSSLTGIGRGRLEREAKEDFPFLPSGSQIVMDKVSREAILENLRNQVGGRWQDLRQELRRLSDVDLAQFLAESGAELPDLIRSGRSWTRLRREAGLPTPPPGPREDEVLKRARNLAHVDDAARSSTYLRLLGDDTSLDELSPVEREIA
jgi:superfamily II DNA or RNA helicase/HKD family nuclease